MCRANCDRPAHPPHGLREFLYGPVSQRPPDFGVALKSTLIVNKDTEPGEGEGYAVEGSILHRATFLPFKALRGIEFNVTLSVTDSLKVMFVEIYSASPIGGVLLDLS